MILFDQPSTPRRSVRLDTLLRLRWLAVAGQVVALFVVEFGLGSNFRCSIASRSSRSIRR